MHFVACTYLSSVSIPNSVTSIGDYAFEMTERLTSLTLGTSLQSIGSSVFRKYDHIASLTSVTIPSSVTSIGLRAFAGNDALASISVASGNTVYDSRNSCNAIVQKSNNMIIQGCLNTTIPSTVTAIGECAFYDLGGQYSLDIPSSVKSIGMSAFGGQNKKNGLKELTVHWNTPISCGESVFSLSDGAILHVPYKSKSLYAAANEWKKFLSIDDLSSIIDFADSKVKSICVANWDVDDDGELSIGEALKVTDLGESFRGNSSITTFNELKYFENLSSICNDAFRDCSNLSSVELSGNVTKIGDWAFAECENLTEINFPEGLKLIGDRTFENCDLQNVVLPKSLEKTGAWCFLGNKALTSAGPSGNGYEYAITYPNSWSSLHENIFSGTPITSAVITDNISAIGNGVFMDCGLLTDVVLPNTIEEIGEMSFGGCGKLQSINFPNGLKTIGLRAFLGCDLQKVVLPESLEKAGAWSFLENKALTSAGPSGDGHDYAITYPNSWTSLHENAFSGAPITSVVITDNISVIGSGVFMGCGSLTDIVLPNTIEEIGELSFGDCGKLQSINFPNGLKTIGLRAFLGCDLQKVVIPESLEKAGAWSFLENKALTSAGPYGDGHDYAITYPNSWTSLLENIFSGTPITSAVITDNISVIGSSVFMDCGSLANVVLPNTIEEIEGFAFIGCNNLTSINFPESLKSIGTRAFDFCDKLTVLSQPLKSSHTRVHETCRALNEVFKLAEDLKNPSLNKSQRSPHGSLEVKCGGCKHDIDGVSEKTLVEVAS